MSTRSHIEYVQHTFNPWWGCVPVSPGCDHCYAERDAARFQPGAPLWGTDAVYREFGDAHWREPVRWNRAAERAGTPARVLCASMILRNFPSISASPRPACAKPSERLLPSLRSSTDATPRPAGCGTCRWRRRGRPGLCSVRPFSIRASL